MQRAYEVSREIAWWPKRMRCGKWLWLKPHVIVHLVECHVHCEFVSIHMSTDDYLCWVMSGNPKLELM